MEESKRLRELQEAYKIFGTPTGATVLADIAAESGMFNLPNQLDPQALAFQAGGRSVMLRILDNLDKATLTKFYREHIKNG